MDKIIRTPCGEIKGVQSKYEGVVAFKGIRYATAERWKYPEIITAWDGVYDATQYGKCSYQPRAFYNEEENPKKIFYYNEFRKGEVYTYDEDCLFLNIFTPENATKESRLPVLLYIHGGGFTGGCGHEKHFDAPVWAKNGVVSVTINYRLGPMGFMCLPELKEESGITGNYGLFDQIAAIKWVRNNIAAFGGDADKITIMGQSAGAMSVQHLCQSNITDNLFRGAVMSSGVGMGTMLMSTPEKIFPFWTEVMKRSGCSTLEEFRSLSPEKLFEEWQKAKKEVKGGAMSTMPVKDGKLITDNSAPKRIPYMVGSTSHDMAPAFLYPLTKNWGKKNGAYVWFFDRMLPGDDNGAWHSSDLWYWFGTLDNCWRPMTEKDYQLSNDMVAYLCNFVRNGDPNGDSLPEWKRADESKNVMCIGEKPTTMGKPNFAKLIATTITSKSVGE